MNSSDWIRRFWWLALLLFFAAAEAIAADYLWPLPYGKELSSSFGDWRTRHYHAGVDIRTGGTIGKAVVAPADGYVMRISMSYFGYGKALYLKLDDGRIAVFGHLDHFIPEIENYVEQQQIASASYNQNLLLAPDQFRFHRGDIICYSGQTGVGAPHLHFEIRTPDNVPLNPIGFDGLREPDTKAPEFRRLRLIGNWDDDLQRALGRRLDFTFIRQRGGHDYVLNDTLECDGGRFWLSVEAVDRMEASPWLRPIYSLTLLQDDQPIYQLTYDSLSFDDTYLIDMERNYQMAIHGVDDFFNLVSLPQAKSGSGLCATLSNDVRSLTLVARDIAGNETRAYLPVRRINAVPNTASAFTPNYQRLATLLNRSGQAEQNLSYAFLPAADKLFLLAKLATVQPISATLTRDSASLAVASVLTDLGNGYLLGVADSVGAAGKQNGIYYLHLYAQKTVQTDYVLITDYRRAASVMNEQNSDFVSTDGKFRVSLPPVEQACFPLYRQYFYDVETNRQGRGVTYTVTPSDFPLAKQATFSYNFGSLVPKGAALYSGTAGSASFLGNEIAGGGTTLTARSYRLGTFTMLIDTISPSIRLLSALSSTSNRRPQIRCRISDNLSGIRDSLAVLIDGRWCIPVYDPESATLSATPYFDLTNGKHPYEIRVTDRCGNQNRYSGNITVGSRKSSGSKTKRH